MYKSKRLIKKMVKNKNSELLGNRKKCQASLEFLVTYGWAIAIIGVVIAVIYSFGLLDFEKYLPSECSFYGQTGCKDFYLSTESFNISVVNNYGIPLVIKEIYFIGDAKTLCNDTFEDSERVVWRNGKTASLSFNLSSAKCNQTLIRKKIIPDKKIDAEFRLAFFSNKTCSDCWDGTCDSECIHITNGRIYGVVND